MLGYAMLCEATLSEAIRGYAKLR